MFKDGMQKTWESTGESIYERTEDEGISVKDDGADWKMSVWKTREGNDEGGGGGGGGRMGGKESANWRMRGEVQQGRVTGETEVRHEGKMRHWGED